MRNIINLKKSLVVAASFAALIAGGISVAQAGSANVARSQGCGLFDGNGLVVFPDQSNMQTTTTPSGNATFHCKADVTPANSGSAVEWDFNSTGAECGIPQPTVDPVTGWPQYTMTKDWQETVSASGNATITCHAH